MCADRSTNKKKFVPQKIYIFLTINNTFFGFTITVVYTITFTVTFLKQYILQFEGKKVWYLFIATSVNILLVQSKDKPSYYI